MLNGDYTKIQAHSTVTALDKEHVLRMIPRSCCFQINDTCVFKEEIRVF